MGKWLVHRIAGNCCKHKEGIGQLSAIIKMYDTGKTLLSISGEKEITDLLSSLLDLAKAKEERLWSQIEQLRDSRMALLEELLPGESRKEAEEELRRDFQDLEDIIRAVWIVGDCSPRTSAYVISLGTVWIARTVAARMRAEGFSSRYIDGSAFITLRSSASGPEIVWEEMERRWNSFSRSLGDEEFLVTAGGIGATEEGGITFFPGDGAEFTASIMAFLLNAEAVRIWTDARGVMSADPTQVPGAEVIPELSYQEATELAFFGAAMLHPPAMTPAMIKNIPIHIGSFDYPGEGGTKIASTAAREKDRPVKGFSVIEAIALLNVEGAGMIGVPGISGRLFSALNSQGISVILISQASSEHSICCPTPADQGEAAKKVAHSAFEAELAAYRINSIEIESDCAVLAAVGDQMSGIPGISAAFFGSLGKAGVNVRAIAQGSSERNISAVIAAEDAPVALRAVHAGFYLSPQSLSIGIIGPGLIGGTLIKQIAGESLRLKEQFHVDLRVRGITDSKRMTLGETGIDIAGWKDALEQDSIPTNIDTFVDHIDAEYFPHSVIIDCTTSTDLPGHYTTWLDRGIHIITPNKKAGTAPWAEYEKMMDTARRGKRHFLYETTVGAGLPVIGTLRDLIQTGDRIINVEGVFSGTLAYLFWRFDGSAPFSSLVSEAKELGYTEPDPRDDLSGMDIVRKTVILAREIGYRVEVEDVPVKSLVPDALVDVDTAAFMEKMSLMDGELDRLLSEAKSRANVLKYAGSIDEEGRCRVELKEYPAEHPFARISGSDNIVAFTTHRYREQPLVIQGPGAGPEVTAGGVFADLLRLASYLGAKL